MCFALQKKEIAELLIRHSALTFKKEYNVECPGELPE